MTMTVLNMPVFRAILAAAAATSELSKCTYRPVRRSAPLFHMQHLELAPEGWRNCVEKIADGFAEVFGEHAYCLNCGCVLDGDEGHDITCMTMVARRILANEPWLHAQHHAAQEAQFPSADIDAVHRAWVRKDFSLARTV